MQTLALMLVAVALSLLVGVPLGIVAGRSDRFNRFDHAGARRDADHPGVRVPDAGRHLLLRRPGRRGDHDDGLLGAACGADHGARDPQRAGEHGRGGAGARVDRAAGALEGAAAARAPAAAAVGQPDDPVRALDGRDRRPDQHRGRPRRAGDERAQLGPGARDPRRRGDRRDGDRARPRDRGDRRADRSRASGTSTRAGQEARAAARPARCSAAVAVAAILGHVLSAGSAYTRWTAQDWLRTYVQNVLDYVQKPTTFLFKDLTNPVGNFLVAHMLQPLDTFLVETPWFITLAGLCRDRVRAQRAAARGDDGADVRADRRGRRVAATRWTRSRRCSSRRRSRS